MQDEKKEEPNANEKNVQTGHPVERQKERTANAKSDSRGHVNPQGNLEWTPGLFLQGETPETRRAGRPREADGVRREKEERTCAVNAAAGPPRAQVLDLKIEWPNDTCVCGLMRSEHAGEHPERRCQQFVLRTVESHTPEIPTPKATDMCTCGHDRTVHAHGFNNATQQHVYLFCDDCRCRRFVLDTPLRRKLDDSQDVCTCGHKRQDHGRVILNDTIIDACSGGPFGNDCECEVWRIVRRGD